jgi:hypothetical protein
MLFVCCCCSIIILSLSASTYTVLSTYLFTGKGRRVKRRRAGKPTLRITQKMLKRRKNTCSVEFFCIVLSWIFVFVLVHQRGSWFGSCYEKMDTRIVHWEEKLNDFQHRMPTMISTKSLQAFRESRTIWHREFKHLVVSVENEFHDDDIGEVCLHGVLYIYLASNLVAILFFAFIFIYFLYQETRTPYGASRQQISFAAYGFTWSFGLLLCLNYGFFRILSNMVSISYKFRSCLLVLKKMQVALIDDDLLNFDSLDLRATLWDGYRFGFHDPLFNSHLDGKQFNRIFYYIMFIIVVILIILGLLWFRSTRTRIFRWRLGIESTVCIGILLPDEKVVARVGSGCLVRDASGELGILTNWHLFRNYATARNDQEIMMCKRKFERKDLCQHRRKFSDGAHFSYSMLEPKHKIVIGTARDSLHGRPNWQFIADNPDTNRSSPAADYTPNGDGLDLVYLNLSNFIWFHGMQEKDRTKMAYDDLTIENENEPPNVRLSSFKKKIYRWKLNGFTFGRTENLEKGYHKLRLLGYPGIGGHGLSVITDYFTGHRQDKTGAWLLTAQPMPTGCSGGAVVNPEGELVGVATQTQGELSHIRSIVDAAALLDYQDDVDLLRETYPETSDSIAVFEGIDTGLKAPRLKRQLTPRRQEKKESLPTHVNKHNKKKCTNFRVLVFTRFLENYKLTGTTSSFSSQIDKDDADENEVGILPEHFENGKSSFSAFFSPLIRWSQNIFKKNAILQKNIRKKKL